MGRRHKRQGIYIYTHTQLIHIVVQHKLKQFFKATSSPTSKKRIKGVIQERFFVFVPEKAQRRGEILPKQLLSEILRFTRTI